MAKIKSTSKAKNKNKKVNKNIINVNIGNKRNKPSKWQAVPLKGSFMILAILGFFITAYIIYPISSNFGIALMLAFVAMFIASLISMTKAPVVEV